MKVKMILPALTEATFCLIALLAIGGSLARAEADTIQKLWVTCL